MEKKIAIKLFEQKQVRTHWNEDEEKWYFSVQDIVEILSESKDVKQYKKNAKPKSRAKCQLGYNLYPPYNDGSR